MYVREEPGKEIWIHARLELLIELEIRIINVSCNLAYHLLIIHRINLSDAKDS